MQAVKIFVREIDDTGQLVQPGAGLTFSGLNLVVALKKGYVPLAASKSYG